MHAISLITTDASTPEKVAETTTLQINGRTVEGVKKCQIKWSQGTIPEVILELVPGALTATVSADTEIAFQQSRFAGDAIQPKAR